MAQTTPSASQSYFVDVKTSKTQTTPSELLVLYLFEIRFILTQLKVDEPFYKISAFSRYIFENSPTAIQFLDIYTASVYATTNTCSLSNRLYTMLPHISYKRIAFVVKHPFSLQAYWNDKKYHIFVSYLKQTKKKYIFWLKTASGVRKKCHLLWEPLPRRLWVITPWIFLHNEEYIKKI